MAFAIRDLSVLAYAQGFTFWHYKAGANGLGAVAEPGYLNRAADMLAAGDMLAVSSPQGGRVLCVLEVTPRVTLAPLS